VKPAAAIVADIVAEAASVLAKVASQAE
jgi:hypothetical protein